MMKIIQPGVLQDAIWELGLTVEPDENREYADITCCGNVLATVDFIRQSIETNLRIKWNFNTYGLGWKPSEADLDRGLTELNRKLRPLWEANGFEVFYEGSISSYEPEPEKSNARRPVGLVPAVIYPDSPETAASAVTFILMEEKEVWIG